MWQRLHAACRRISPLAGKANNNNNKCGLTSGTGRAGGAGGACRAGGASGAWRSGHSAVALRTTHMSFMPFAGLVKDEFSSARTPQRTVHLRAYQIKALLFEWDTCVHVSLPYGTFARVQKLPAAKQGRDAGGCVPTSGSRGCTRSHARAGRPCSRGRRRSTCWREGSSWCP